MSSPSPRADLGGLAEVAALVGRSSQVVNSWRARGSPPTPAPLVRLAATPVWELAAWRQWAKSHTDFVIWRDVTDPGLRRWADMHPTRIPTEEFR